ncbi:HNH endonuclease [Polynucleobacter acidiphobus]|uniref:HNH endonuclease n=1 Tax=Polynucleobacter acidiphobus TaxID=556053 RepID=UPI000D3425AD|nr:HNH endonuclease signature motif containing protein [Polynucleobacter acidiphobus]
MLGRIRQKQIDSIEAASVSSNPIICPICEREIPSAQMDAHHLIPRSKGGKETQYLHRICHRQIHALFTETELAKRLNSADAIRQHPQMQRFIEWVKNKPDGFYERVSKSSRLKER